MDLVNLVESLGRKPLTGLDEKCGCMDGAANAVPKTDGIQSEVSVTARALMSLADEVERLDNKIKLLVGRMKPSLSVAAPVVVKDDGPIGVSYCSALVKAINANRERIEKMSAIIEDVYGRCEL